MKANRWALGLVRNVRAGEVSTTPGSVLAKITDSELDSPTAAAELLNVLRPTVSVAWLGAFAAARLAENPGWRERLASGNPIDGLVFAQEVCRTTPFAPFIVGRAIRDSEIGDQYVERGDAMVLDVVGIHHDPARWPDPITFAPERFINRPADGFELVSHGGGHLSGHRCPGESLTLRLLAATATTLAEVDYRVLDNGVDRTRIPTLPGGRTRLVDVHAVASAPPDVVVPIRLEVTADIAESRSN